MGHDDYVIGLPAEHLRRRIDHVVTFGTLARDCAGAEDGREFLRELLLVLPPDLAVDGERPVVAVTGSLVRREDRVLPVGRIDVPEHLLLFVAELAQPLVLQFVELREVGNGNGGDAEVPVLGLPNLVPEVVSTDKVGLVAGIVDVIDRGVLGVVVLDELLAP